MTHKIPFPSTKLAVCAILLRGFYQDSLLRYDSAGQLKHHAETGPWTIAFVYINSLDSKNGKTSLKANRVVQIFDPKKQMFRANGTDLPVVIEIEADPANESAIRQALANVFIGGREPLAQFVPITGAPWSNALLTTARFAPNRSSK